ncbi:MAG: altronate dehydratase family protein [Sphaerochaeta sp.]|jgi:altronate hydrolase|nr:altronate dehydratase family protein [Sphaerochaeta sp.]
MKQVSYLKVHPADTVAVAVAALEAGVPVTIDGRTITLAEAIAQGHKFSLKAIKAGEPIIKYGAPIGAATADIDIGRHVHDTNIRTLLEEEGIYRRDEEVVRHYTEKAVALRAVWRDKVPTISAYKRSEGTIGIRNEIWIVPTVGCVNRTGQLLARWADEHLPAAPFWDGIHVWTHPWGCSQLGDDHENTRTILADLVHHPNAGGVLVLSLGCENNTPESFRKLLGPVDEKRVKFLTTQHVTDELEAAKEMIRALYETMKEDRREEVGMDNLIVGFKCGGSDGMSGITANPLVGRFCDALTAMGGSAILTEVPEMFGAEQLLMNRTASEEVFEETVALINDFKHYFTAHDQVVYENPSPGNKEGGISTLEDKSLGCIQKGGEAIITDVIAYGKRVTKRGLTLLSGPGNDIVSTTALTASGAHIILFTTGRGTPLGAPVPTIKISSNTPLAEKKANWIDFDGARLLSQEGDVVLNDLIALIKAIASGEKRAQNEINGYAEISIFKDGVIL